MKVVHRRAFIVDLGDREEGRVIRGPDEAEVDAVLQEPGPQDPPELVVRQTAQEGHRQPQAAECPGGVVWASTRAGGDAAIRPDHEIDQALARHDDHRSTVDRQRERRSPTGSSG